MKKFLKKAANITLAVIAAILVVCGALTACGGKTSGNKEPLTPDTPSSSVVYYIVSFDSVGGTATESQRVEAGKTAKRPKDPEKSSEARKEYLFIGWYSGEELWDFENTAVTADLTLTARYKTTEYSQEVLPSK